jgi:hypothetical protein
MSDVVFSPYDAHRAFRPLTDECFFSGWLRCGKKLGKHLPERVLRQFKHVQGIPRDPAVSATPGMTISQIDRVWLEELQMRMIDEDIRGRVVVNPWTKKLATYLGSTKCRILLCVRYKLSNNHLGHLC